MSLHKGLAHYNTAVVLALRVWPGLSSHGQVHETGQLLSELILHLRPNPVRPGSLHFPGFVGSHPYLSTPIDARNIDCLVGRVTMEIGHLYIVDCTTVVGRMDLLSNTLDQD
jgi:hypothetical protein